MRIPLFLTAALLVAACGDPASDVAQQSPEQTPSTTTSTVTEDIPVEEIAVEEIAAYVIGSPPVGYRATNADDRSALAEISYTDRRCGSLDWYAQVRVTEQFELHEGRPGDHEPHVLPDGTEVEVLDLWDDGRPYGYGASWELTDGRWVALRYDEVLTLDQFREGLGSLVPVDDAEWTRLRRALAIDTHVGRPDPDAVEVDVDLGELAGAPASVTFHLPGDFPLGEDDCRRACFSLVHSGVTIPVNCSTFPLVLRVGEGIVVASLLDPVVESVVIDVGPGVVVSDSEPRQADSLDVPVVPDRFFAVAVPSDWCHFVVSSPDADFGTGLGEGGIPRLRPDSAGCDFDVEPVEYEPPTECNEVERDWVASTTSLRPIECPVDRPAAASTTTQPAADDDG